MFITPIFSFFVPSDVTAVFESLPMLLFMQLSKARAHRTIQIMVLYSLWGIFINFSHKSNIMLFTLLTVFRSIERVHDSLKKPTWLISKRSRSC